jgi:nucleoside-diphosphate-sugar epimerase
VAVVLLVMLVLLLAAPAQLMKVDVRDAAALRTLFDAARFDVVIHAASWGMSGPQQLQSDLLQSINVGGTATLVDLCRHFGVGVMLYVSSYNVVFNGCTIENGTEETLAVLPDDQHVDPCAWKVSAG